MALKGEGGAGVPGPLANLTDLLKARAEGYRPMLFALICTDKPASLDLRLATRAAHLAYLETYAERIRDAGGLLDADGRPCGSLLLIEAEDAAAAAGFAESDPYHRAGLFESVVIRPYRQVYRDGERRA